MTNKHIGSSFDDFLIEEGIYNEVHTAAIKRVIAYQIAESMRVQGITASELAIKMETSRSSVNRLLDPENQSVTLTTLERAANILGKRLHFELR